MVILVLLATLVAPRVVGYLGSSRSKSANVQIENLTTALELFYLDMGSYPSGDEGLDALVKPVTGKAGWNGPYLTKAVVPLDPWDAPIAMPIPARKASSTSTPWAAMTRKAAAAKTPTCGIEGQVQYSIKLTGASLSPDAERVGGRGQGEGVVQLVSARPSRTQPPPLSRHASHGGEGRHAAVLLVRMPR